jgi:hypothetical protein
MSNPVYEVLDPFLELKLFLHGLSEEDRERVMQALAAVQKEPRRPKGYAFKKLKFVGNYQVEIPLAHELLAVSYEIWPLAQEIRITEVREVGDLRRAKDWLTGLLDIVPKKDQ